MKTYNKFTDIEHLPLRVFNRVVMMSNLMQDFGKDAARSYAESFTDAERKQMFIMQQFIEINGEKEARKVVTKGLELAPEEELEDV